jgi:hypothetical protein
MFYNSTENKYIQEGTSFTLDGIQYPPSWLNQSTPEQKAAVGLEEVIATNSPKDDRYYWVSSSREGASLTYTNTPKDLDQVKAMAVSQVNAAAYSILLQSDWMVVKSIETSTPMDTAWSTWRASIRTSAAEAVAAINAASDVDAVATAAQVEWATDPNNVTE